MMIESVVNAQELEIVTVEELNEFVETSM